MVQIHLHNKDWQSEERLRMLQMPVHFRNIFLVQSEACSPCVSLCSIGSTMATRCGLG